LNNAEDIVVIVSISEMRGWLGWARKVFVPVVLNWDIQALNETVAA
jgi:hypothetical protein